MTVNELIQSLARYPGDTQVMARDVVAYRGISCYEQVITKQDACDHADCEDRVGETIVVL